MLRIFSVIALISLVAATGFIAGSMAGLLRAPPATAVMSFFVDHLLCPSIDCGFDDTSDRSLVDCSPYTREAQRTMVLLSLGQSNGANHGESRMVPRAGVDNFNTADGKCYAAKDPLLGPTGTDGSPWTRLGDRLLEEGIYDRVLVAAIAVGGSRIERWAPGGDLNGRLAWTAKALDSAGIRVTHVAWHQGESNSDDTEEEYTAAFGEVLRTLRDLGIDAPVFPAVATICFDAGSDEIRRAQAALPGLYPGVFPGPNTDALDRFEHRHDLCHLSTLGLDLHAELWLAALVEHSKQTSPVEPEI